MNEEEMNLKECNLDCELNFHEKEALKSEVRGAIEEIVEENVIDRINANHLLKKLGLEE